MRVDENLSPRELGELLEALALYHHDAERALAAAITLRDSERRLALLVAELKDAGVLRSAGRPALDSDALEISAREIFGDSHTQRAANRFAEVPEDQWRRTLEKARKWGDASRAVVLRMLNGNSRISR